jgi:hypothetical protein
MSLILRGSMDHYSTFTWVMAQLATGTLPLPPISFNDTGNNFFAGVVDTSDKHSFAYGISSRIFEKIQNGPIGGARGTLIHEKNLKSNIWCQTPFKGTVSRDFRLLVFFMNQFPPSPSVHHQGRLEFFPKFAEIVAAKGLPPVSLTPVANAKNL